MVLDIPSPYLDELMKEEILIEMASELPEDAIQWDNEDFNGNAYAEAVYRGLVDGRYDAFGVGQAVRKLFAERS